MKTKLVLFLMSLMLSSLLSSCNSRSSEQEFKYEVAKQSEKEADTAFKDGEKEINIAKVKRTYAEGGASFSTRSIPAGCSLANIQRGQNYASQMLDNKKLQKWRKRESDNKCLQLKEIIQNENAKRNQRRKPSLDYAAINAKRNILSATTARESWFNELNNKIGKSFYSEQRNKYEKCLEGSKERISSVTENDCFLAIKKWAETPWSLTEEIDPWTDSKRYYLKANQPNYPKSTSSILQSLQTKKKTNDYEISFECDAESNMFQLKTDSLLKVKNDTNNTVFFSKDAHYLETDIKIGDALLSNVRFSKKSQGSTSNPRFMISNVDEMKKILSGIENQSIMKIRLHHALIDNWKFNDETFDRYIDGTEKVGVSSSNGSDIVIQINLFGFFSQLEKTKDLCPETKN